MTRPLLSDRTMTNLRALLPRGVLQAAESLAVGGDTWSVSRPAASDGVNAPAGPTAPGNITGYVVSPKLASFAGTLSGTAIPADQWRLYADTNQDTETGDTITSADDSSLKFLLQTKDAQIGYSVYLLKPTT